MTENQKARFQNAVSQAMRASPYSRHMHESYYKEQKAYGYAIEDIDSERAAYVRSFINNGYQVTSLKLVLNMAVNDTDLLRAIHHELTHIHQVLEFQKHKVEYSAVNISITDYLAKSLIQEIHAVTAEQEGPLLGFAENLARGEMSEIGAYAAYAENEPEMFKTYSGAVLNDPQIRQMPVYKAVDHIGYRFMNSNEAIQKAELVKARQSSAREFVQKTGMRNNDTVEYYIGAKISEYQKAKRSENDPSRDFHDPMGIFAGIFDQEQSDFLGFKPPVKAPTLERLSQIISNKDGMFLSLPQWQETLNAKDNKEFIGKLLLGSAHQTAYHRIVEQNKRDGLIP